MVKNEADIIAYSLNQYALWAEKIFVYDNGSTDNTWEIVQEAASKNDKIVPWKKEYKPFRDCLRAEVFNEFKHHASEGDWWCFRMDSDEFYIDDPREFLANVPSIYHVVCSDSFEYKLTHEDVAELNFTDESPHDILQLKYYSPFTYSEKRFFKHRKRLVWNNTDSYPKHIGVISPKRIRLKHFQYRSPNQIQLRLDTRRKATADGYKFFGHTNQAHWQEKLEHRKDLIQETPAFFNKGCRQNNLPPKHVQLANIALHYLGIYP